MYCAHRYRTTEDLAHLNTENGLAGSTLDKFIELRAQQRRRDASYGEDGKEQRKKAALAKIEASGRITAGVWFSAGENILTRDLFERVQEKERKKEKEESDKRQRKQDQEDGLKRKVGEVRAKNQEPAQWTIADLKTMVKWYKRPGDSKLPGSKTKLMERYFITCGRVETDREHLKDGELPVIDGTGIDGGGGGGAET